MCNGSQPRGRGRYDGYGRTAIDSIVDLLGGNESYLSAHGPACQDSYGETRPRTSEVGQVQGKLHPAAQARGRGLSRRNGAAGRTG